MIILESLLKLGKRIIPQPIFNFFQPIYHLLLIMLAVFWYRFPSRKMKIIGVTGTNGKSTAIYLISQILEQGGYNVAAFSSIEFKIKDKIWKNDLKMTMPGRFKLQKLLRQAYKAGCEYVVLEVTSEGIKQHRHHFIGFDIAVLTNLTEEHLESHGGFEKYKQAKSKLFQMLKLKGSAIVNLDDLNAEYFLQFPAKEKWGYGIDFESSTEVNQTVKASDYQLSKKGISFRVDGQDFDVNLLGKFNLHNILAAISVGLIEGISLDKIKLALEKVNSISGRLEIVIKNPFMVIVDYAHTPDALEKVYQMIRELFSSSPDGGTRRIIGVLGAAGGGRDKWKRVEFGKIAEKYLDKIIIANEDPYNEDPQAIIDDIAKGLKNRLAEKFIDRREAIHRALESAQDGDIVIITGKGCESWLCVDKGKKIAWDDRKIVKEEMKKISN